MRLPDGNMIVMGHQKFSAPEIIFQVIDDNDDDDDGDDDDYVYDHQP